MAEGFYNRFKANLMNKEIDLEADTIKVMLLDDNHVFTAADNVIGDVDANEIAGAGYVAGGGTLGGKAVTQGATTKWDGTDIQWAAATFTTYNAVIWDDTIATDDLCLSIDFGGAKSVAAGIFKIEFHVNGIVTLGTAA